MNTLTGHPRLLLWLAAGLMLLAGGAAVASDHHHRIKGLADSGRILPLSDVLNRARKDHPGRVLEAELEAEGEQFVYEVEMLDRGGRVRELHYDAATGQLLKE
jgi:uncharacterized membrane protein YkoI